MNTIQFLVNATYAILSGAVNTPFTGEDIIRTRQLRTRLEAAGFRTFAALGSYLGNHEPSIFVLFDSRKGSTLQLARVMSLAAEFNQKQVFYANRGVFTAPFVSEHRESYSKSNNLVYGSEARFLDGYTEVSTTEGNLIFSVPDLYESERAVSRVQIHIADEVFEATV